MTATNQSVVGDRCVKNVRGVLATSDREKHLAWKEHYQRPLNAKFEWDKVNLKGKASRTSEVVSKMLLTFDDLGIEQMTNIFDQIIAENKVPEHWNKGEIVNCFKNAGEATVFKRVIEQKIREMLDMDAI